MIPTRGRHAEEVRRLRLAWCPVCFAIAGEPCRRPSATVRPPHTERLAGPRVPLSREEATNKLTDIAWLVRKLFEIGPDGLARLRSVGGIPMGLVGREERLARRLLNELNGALDG